MERICYDNVTFSTSFHHIGQLVSTKSLGIDKKSSSALGRTYTYQLLLSKLHEHLDSIADFLLVTNLQYFEEC